MAERDPLSEKLIGACKRGDSGSVQELLSRGADPSYWDWIWTTPLHFASRYVYVCVQLNKCVQLVKHVLSSGIQYLHTCMHGCRRYCT